MDTIKKEITQNPERYSKKADKYQISASSSIKPLDLPIGTKPDNILAVLEADGIIVNVGKYKLISQKTLDLINNSNNPHYDIATNGIVKTTSGKSGSIGHTIPNITLNVDQLPITGSNRDILNQVAGVVSVDYVYEGKYIPNTTLSQNLVDQINYTLNQSTLRPKDTYTIAELDLSDQSNYDITGFQLVTAQDINNNIFDYGKMSDFLMGVKDRMIALNQDFHTIQDIHYKGLIPTGNPTYSITRMATAEDVQEPDDFQIVYKTSKTISVQPTPSIQYPTGPAPTGSSNIGSGGGSTNGGGGGANNNPTMPGSFNNGQVDKPLRQNLQR